MKCNCDNFPARARHRIVIQSRTDTGDNYGGQTPGWATALTVWAILEPQSGRESFAQGQDQSRVDMKFTIRYQSTLSNTATAGKYRISYDGRYFPVAYVKNFDEDGKGEGKAYQVLACLENAAENQ